MKDAKYIYLSLLKCNKKLEKSYKKDMKRIKKNYKDESLKQEMLSNLEYQYFANQLALQGSIDKKKENINLVETIA